MKCNNSFRCHFEFRVELEEMFISQKQNSSIRNRHSIFKAKIDILGLLLVQFSGSVHLSCFTGKANFAVVILSAQRSTLLLVSRNMSRVDGSIRLCEIERLL